MPEENLELVRRIHSADACGDYELGLSLFSPDVELDVTNMPDGRVLRGRDALRGYIAEWRSGWRDFQEEVEEVIDAGTCVVTFYCDRGVGRSSGAETEIRFASVWELSEGKVVRVKSFLDRDEALRYAGLG